MRVLVISCNTGEGHNAAGRAIYENLTDRGIDAEFVNMMSLMGEKVDRAVSGTYVNPRGFLLFSIQSTGSGERSAVFYLKCM